MIYADTHDPYYRRFIAEDGHLVPIRRQQAVPFRRSTGTESADSSTTSSENSFMFMNITRAAVMSPWQFLWL